MKMEDKMEKRTHTFSKLIIEIGVVGRDK